MALEARPETVPARLPGAFVQFLLNVQDVAQPRFVGCAGCCFELLKAVVFEHGQRCAQCCVLAVAEGDGVAERRHWIFQILSMLKAFSMEIRPIHTKADYRAALKTVSALVDADPMRGTPDAVRLEVLGTRLEAYEAQHFPLGLAGIRDT